MITQTAMTELENYLLGRISAVQFQCGEAWYAADFTKDIVADGNKVVVNVIIDAETAAETTVTGLRILNANGETLAQRSEQIIRAGSDEDILYRMEFTISALEA